ncbi:MAG: ankyrin repeat domain-containing protein [Bacteroidetes bacterium]|nr:ankyrin repeat domain-containing protein [Bacteroidota bacterium]
MELHSPEGLQLCFQDGLDSNTVYEGSSLLELFLSMYTRSPRFTDCIRVLSKHNCASNDKLLNYLLLDDVSGVSIVLNEFPGMLNKTYSFRSAYTPLFQASLLHICAEFNLIKCGKLLLAKGMNVNTPAGKDDFGFGGQSPIFHTVNQNSNASKEMFHLLLDYDADLNYNVNGIIWGKGFDWETFIPAINPISYAMFGLLPQMHRNPMEIATTIDIMQYKKFGFSFKLPNIPCKYLQQ